VSRSAATDRGKARRVRVVRHPRGYLQHPLTLTLSPEDGGEGICSVFPSPKTGRREKGCRIAFLFTASFSLLVASISLLVSVAASSDRSFYCSFVLLSHRRSLRSLHGRAAPSGFHRAGREAGSATQGCRAFSARRVARPKPRLEPSIWRTLSRRIFEPVRALAGRRPCAGCRFPVARGPIETGARGSPRTGWPA
jgi:hypothetical protein